MEKEQKDLRKSSGHQILFTWGVSSFGEILLMMITRVGGHFHSLPLGIPKSQKIAKEHVVYHENLW